MAMELDDCEACGGLVPPSARACVHCGATSRAWPPWVRALARAAAGGAALVTLMACYGLPPGYYRAPPPTADACPGNDADKDGVCAPADCDDHDPAVYPGAADPDGDGIDQNCDGVDGWRDPGVVAVPAP